MKIETDQFASASHVADLLNEARPTLLYAVKTGQVETVTFPCGTMLVDIASARKWAKSPRTPGRPPKDRKKVQRIRNPQAKRAKRRK